MTTCLVPPDRYARMNNVWFLPSVAALSRWLERVGFESIGCLDVSVTTTEEQRKTDWMQFESFEYAIDPDNDALPSRACSVRDTSCPPSQIASDLSRSRVLKPICATIAPFPNDVSGVTSMFQLNLAPADPILGLTETFKADTHPDKINLGVGVYQDATGKTPILKAVTRLRLIF